MQSKQKIARTVRSIVENRLVLGAEESRGRNVLRSAAAAAAAAVSSSSETTVEPGAHVLIAPPGAGNIGDQAMVEAFIGAVEGLVIVVTRRPGDLSPMPPELESRVTRVALPGLLYGLPWQHVRDLRVLARQIVSARSVSVVGADIMDGAYWESPSVRRFRLARFAAEFGIDARVLGFSWNESPTPAAKRAMVAASRSVDLLGRDPVSVRRLVADGGERIVPVADIALLTEPRPISEPGLEEWCAEQRSAGRRIVILNANGLIEAGSSLVDTYLSLFTSEAASNCAFIALPHVSRGVPSDVDLVNALAEKAATGVPIFAVRRLLAPGEIATIAERADLAVTGRMHLAILCTRVGTPVVTVGYQGKVAGFYELLGTSTFINGGSDARSGLLPMIERALIDLPSLTEAIKAARVHVTNLAMRNVAGLTEAR